MNFRKIWSESMSIKCCFKQRIPCLNYSLTLHKIKQNMQLHLINTRTILVLVTLTDKRCYRMYINHNVPFFLSVYTKCYLFCAKIMYFVEYQANKIVKPCYFPISLWQLALFRCGSWRNSFYSSDE